MISSPAADAYTHLVDSFSTKNMLITEKKGDKHKRKIGDTEMLFLGIMRKTDRDIN